MENMLGYPRSDGLARQIHTLLTFRYEAVPRGGVGYDFVSD